MSSGSSPYSSSSSTWFSAQNTVSMSNTSRLHVNVNEMEQYLTFLTAKQNALRCKHYKGFAISTNQTYFIFKTIHHTKEQ